MIGRTTPKTRWAVLNVAQEGHYAQPQLRRPTADSVRCGHPAMPLCALEDAHSLPLCARSETHVCRGSLGPADVRRPGLDTDMTAVALVAGATRGAGRAIAVELAPSGYHVYATGRSSRTSGPSEIGRRETIEETGDLVAAVGSGTAVVVDHEDAAAVEALSERIESEHGRLDVLVDDVFGGDRYAQWDKPLWEHDLSGGLRMLRMGVDTHLVTAHFALPLLLRGESGVLIEMTDGTSEFNASYRQGVGFYYDLVKGTVDRVVRSLAAELEGHSVTALGVTPGWLRSENMLDGFGVPRTPGGTPWRSSLASPSRSPRRTSPAVLPRWPPLVTRSGGPGRS
jgi:NAD(P)-dependent dehydrogenase (short-subunit alcohol dehydrogenase family)